MAQGTNGAWLALGVAGAVAAAGAVVGRSGSRSTKLDKLDRMRVHTWMQGQDAEIPARVILRVLDARSDAKAKSAARHLREIASRYDAYSNESFDVLSHAWSVAGWPDARGKTLQQRRGSRAKKPWSKMTLAEREQQERAFRRFKQQSHRSKSQERSRQEREPDWHRSWYDTSGELD